MLRRLTRWSVLPALLLCGCAIPRVIDTLDDTSPPPEFGRPGWVRTVAGVGGWFGGIVGGIASIVFLPVTYPLSLLADDGFGESSSDEFLLFPATSLAALGHCFVGLPADVVDWGLRRAWVGSQDPVMSYDMIPLEGPRLPQPRTAAAEAENPPR